MSDGWLFIEQFHFLRPLWLLALLPLTLILVLLWRRQTRFGAWEQVIAPHLLPHLIAGNQTSKRRLPLYLLTLAWLLAAIALAGPTWKKLPQPVQQKVDATVVLLDLSLSMYAKDLPPSRLLRARLKLNDILQQTREGTMALVAFAGSTHVVSPLTDDTNTILNMVNSLSPDIMPIKGSDPVAAMERGIALFEQAGTQQGRILLITDDLPEQFASQVKPQLPAGIKLSVLAVGTEQGGPIELPDGSFAKTAAGSIVIPALEVSKLRKNARQLDARLARMTTTDDDIKYLLPANDRLAQSDLIDTDRKFDTWDEMGHWLVLLMLPLVAASYRRGWLGAWLMPLVAGSLLLKPQPGYSFDWQDLWRTQNQQGQDLVAKDEYEQAAAAFKDPAWKGYSYYQSQDYEQAQQFFQDNLAQQPNDPQSHYNLGNAQAQLQQFDQAIASYEKALQLDPSMEDAKANLELIKQLQEQQQQQQESDDKQDSDDQDSGEQDSDDQNSENQDGENQDSQNEPSDAEDQNAESQPSGDQDQEQQNSEQSQQQTDEDQDAESDNQEQTSPEMTEPAEDSESPEPEQSQAMDQMSAEEAENQQALEQWLRKIPDDPGGLLRRKFLQESQQQPYRPSGDTPW